MIVAALCHDIRKVISIENHPAIAAEILKPYVRVRLTKSSVTHQDFQDGTTTPYFGRDPAAARTVRPINPGLR